MLMVPPSLARKKELRRERDARRGRLGRGTFDNLVRDLARVIRMAFAAGATGSLWGLEGPLRAGIRSDLCLQGWRWRDADDMAREILDEAFRIVRALRPSWNDGQPEWTVEAGTLIERTRCVRCGKPLPEENHKFCSVICRNGQDNYIARIKRAGEDQAVRTAINSL